MIEIQVSISLAKEQSGITLSEQPTFLLMRVSTLHQINRLMCMSLSKTIAGHSLINSTLILNSWIIQPTNNSSWPMICFKKMVPSQLPSRCILTTSLPTSQNTIFCRSSMTGPENHRLMSTRPSILWSSQMPTLKISSSPTTSLPPKLNPSCSLPYSPSFWSNQL